MDKFGRPDTKDDSIFDSCLSTNLPGWGSGVVGGLPIFACYIVWDPASSAEINSWTNKAPSAKNIWYFQQ